MLSIIENLSRFVLPPIAFFIICVCIISLLRGRSRIHSMAILVNAANGDRIIVRHWETSIGRSKSCDVLLNYPTVSRSHAVLSRRKYGWVVTDTYSKTGVFVNSEKVDGEAMVYDGDTIAFGTAVIYFSSPDSPPPADHVKSSDRGSLKEDTAEIPQINNDVYSNPTDYEDVYSTSIPKNKMPYLINSKTGERIRIKYIENSIGSSRIADIIVKDPSVMNIHASLNYEKDGWVIKPENSRAKIEINERPIISSVVLSDGDEFSVGDISFVFHQIQ